MIAEPVIAAAVPGMLEPATRAAESGAVCHACGACCAYSADWPRFSTETDAELALIPPRFAALSGMRCVASRCSALDGVVGKGTTCRVYGVRPEVCRTCEPGDEACTMARHAFGFSPVPV